MRGMAPLMWRTVLLALSVAGAARAQEAPAPEAPVQDAPAQPPVQAPVQEQPDPLTEAERGTDELYQGALQSIAEGRKGDASAALRQVVAREPMHAGAWLDLAMLECSLGRGREADRLFAEVETRFNPSEAMLAVIATERETGCGSWKAATSSQLTLARGIDRNVNQGASNPYFVIGGVVAAPLLAEFLPKRDNYTMLTGEYTRELTANGSVGFVQYQARRNDSLSNYDNAALFAGVESPYRFGRWTLRTAAMGGLVTLGGKLYQRQVQLQARIGPPLPLPNSTQFNLMGGVTHTEYLTLTNFNASTYEMRGQFTHRRRDFYASTSLGVQRDVADDLRPGGDRNGYVVNLVARKGLAGQVSGELNYTRQGWHGSAPYLTSVIDQIRRQSTDVVRGTLSYPMGNSQTLQLEARYVRNRENISIFQYNSHQLQLSWQWQPQ